MDDDEAFPLSEEIQFEEFISLSEGKKVKTPSDNKERAVKVLTSNSDWNSIFWSCYYCKKLFNDFVSLKVHQRSFHKMFSDAATIFECSDCNQSLLGYPSFLNHIRNVHYEHLKLCCDVCNKFLDDYEQLSTHRDRHIGSGRKRIHPPIHHCNLCKDVYSAKKSLITHNRESHNTMPTREDGEDVTAPLNDNEVVFNISQLESMKCENDHIDMDLEFIKCEKDYIEKEKVLQCVQNFQSFASDSDLKKRTRFNGSIESELKGGRVIFIKNERMLQCTICYSVYKKKCTLQDHIRKHTGERPFMCEICSRRFSTKRNLRNHRTNCCISISDNESKIM